jgi:predicted nucleotidyltransferase
MLKTIDFKEATDTIIEILEPKTIFIYLMGSLGTDRFHAESDIDIAAFFNKEVDFDCRINLISKLEDRLHREVDLVSLNHIDPIFSRQVLETGRLLLCKDEGFLLNWKTHQMSLYIDLKQSRKVIEENLLNRKKYVK